MNAEISNGDFKSAVQVFSRSVPFTRIISRICDHPCEPVCKRREVGEPIAIRSLERSALAYAPPLDIRALALPEKKQSVAIVGSGLSGLTAAFDLARKGYRVTVFEATDRLGGKLWNYSEELLPRSAMTDDFEALKKAPIDVRFNAFVGVRESPEELLHSHDAVYVGAGRASGRDLGIETGGAGLAVVDAVTFETGLAGIFAGGSAVYGAGSYSPITSISHGRRAAISIDRFLQKVSLRASREKEGAYETRLFTSTEGVEALPRIVMDDPSRGYSAEKAVSEAARCLRCECMECCEDLRISRAIQRLPQKIRSANLQQPLHCHGTTPRKQVYQLVQLVRPLQGSLPEGFHMGEVCKAARNIMVTQGKMPPSAHEFALQDMEFSNSEKATLVRLQPGMASSKYLFFPGCQLTGSSPDHVKKTYKYLTDHMQGGVGLMLRCCGAPADWAGREASLSQVLNSFRAEWEGMGSPQLILACSSCYAIFKRRLPEARLISLWEIFDQYGLPQTDTAPGTGVVAIHDPCTSRHEPQVQESVRNIVRTLGLEIAELPLSRDKTECCGFGGLMYFANRDLADKVVERRIGETNADLLTYCAVCCDHFRSGGKPTWRLLDLIFNEGALSGPQMKAPDYSQRRENRVRLKNSLLAELWSEKGVDQEVQQRIKLSIPDKVRDLMERRMILVEDLRQVIEWAERTGSKLIQKKTGHYLAHYRPGTVTYWVEYSADQEGFVIHNAYSHRMEVLEHLKP